MKCRRSARSLIVLAIVVIAVLVVNSIRLAGNRAEHSLHAVRLVIVVVEKYIQQCGRWPSSWRDLESVNASENGMYSWPCDSEEIQAHVEVNFDLTLESVAHEEVDHFDAIKPRTASYPGFRDNVISLLAEARKQAERGGGKTVVPEVP
jgi:hypothetical protein